MYEELLAGIGLTKSEISVYFALLDLGSSTTGPIIKKAGIASGKAYLILDKLVSKGLVTYTIKSGTKYYQSKDPERLLDYMREKEDELKQKGMELNKIIPTLQARYKEQKYKPMVEVFEGVKGLYTFYDWILKQIKKGDYIYIMGAPRKANERFQPVLMNWNRKRVNLGIKMKVIYNHDCREFGEKRKRMKLTEVRYMKQHLETPAWIDIFGDYVATLNVHGVPVVFLIKDKESADSYRKYFEILWKQSKP